MNPPQSQQSVNAIKRLCEAEIGPLDNARERSWSVLTDFSAWPDLIPDLQGLAVSVNGNPGRGSQLEFNWKTGRQQAVISYWRPQQCFDLVIDEKGRWIGLRFELARCENPARIRLQVSCEVAQHGRFELADRLSRRRIEGRLKASYRNLADGLKIQTQFA